MCIIYIVKTQVGLYNRHFIFNYKINSVLRIPTHIGVDNASGPILFYTNIVVLFYNIILILYNIPILCF